MLFFIVIETRKVFHARAAANPTGAWTTQAARHLFLRHSDQLSGARVLVRDRGSQFIDAPPLAQSALASGAAETTSAAITVATKTTRCDGLINEYRNAA